MKKLTFAVVLIMLVAGSYGQEKNESEKLVARIAIESTYYGLIIGIDQYRDDSIPDLKNPINDAEKLYQVLTSTYNFEEHNITLLKNATKADIIKSIDKIAGEISPDDNLLIFFAGHGYWDSNTNLGYWLPSNASREFIDEWISSKEVVDYLKRINSRHTLLIVDAGFGGSIFAMRKAFKDAPLTIKELYEHPSRKAMTSCQLTEAPDDGVFTKYLVQRLNENTENYLTSEQLFSSFRMAAINNSNAIPRYGEIRNVGDEGGDFIFLKSK